MVSLSGCPSLAIVVERLRLRPGRKRDFWAGLDSVLGVGRPFESMDVWLPLLLMRKKFFNFVVVGVCVPFESPLRCFLEEKERLEKLRFSVAMMLQKTNSMDLQGLRYASSNLSSS